MIGYDWKNGVFVLYFIIVLEDSFEWETSSYIIAINKKVVRQFEKVMPARLSKKGVDKI